MKSFQKEEGFSYKEFFYRFAIFLITVSVIVYFMPKERSFSYQYEINKPWKYGLLQASFDFPIYKGEKQVQEEQDSVLATYAPYYHINTEIREKMIRKFKKDYTDSLVYTIPYPHYRVHIERTLKEIYDNGVISPNDWSQLSQHKIQKIQLVDQNFSK